MTRLYLTAREYDALLKRQSGTCCVAGCEATNGLIAEHATPNALRPGKPDQLFTSRSVFTLWQGRHSVDPNFLRRLFWDSVERERL